MREVLWRMLRVVATAVLLGVAAVTAGTCAGARDAGEVDPAQEPVLRDPAARANPVRIVAMGDSFMSGEGAGSFYDGTDRGGRNSCRRAPTAWPVRVARRLAAAPPPGRDGVHLTFVACSGAKTTNIGDRFVDEDAVPRPKNADEPLQIVALRRRRDADVVLLGVGGNDAGFRRVVLTCSGRQAGCEALAGPWLARLDPLADPRAKQGAYTAKDGIAYVQQSLRDVMRRVRALAPAARRYVTTYPNPLSAPSCPTVGMDEGEARFLTTTFLPQLNSEIELAAALEDFTVVPLFDVLAGAGLCADGPDDHGPAMNGWRFQRIDGVPTSPSQLLAGSMHPTDAGHALVAARVEAQIRRDLAADERRAPTPPPDGALPEPPGPPPIGLPLPEGPWELRENPCVRVARRNENVPRSDGPLRIVSARPRSPVCVASGFGPFARHRVGADGTFELPTSDAVSGPGGRREAIYRAADGVWVWRIEWPRPGTPDSGLTTFQAWLWEPWQFTLAWVLSLLLLVAAAVERRLPGS